MNVKKEAFLLIEDMPDNIDWDDLMYRIYVRKKIEKGLADSDAGRVYSTETLLEKLGLHS